MQQLANSTRIKDLPTQSLVAEMGNKLKEILLTTGLKIEESTSVEFTKMFNRFVMAHYGILTPGEVALAFTLNAAGQLPGDNGRGQQTEKIELFGPHLTIEHVGGVLYRYMQKRANLAKKIVEQGTRNLLPEPEPTPEQQEASDREFANEYFRKFLTGEFSTISVQYAYMVYDVLDRQKVIQLSVKKKKEYFDQAQKNRDQEIALPPASRQEKNEMLNLMDSYMNDAVPMSEQALVKSYAKRLALLDYMKKLKEEGQTKIFK